MPYRRLSEEMEAARRRPAPPVTRPFSDLSPEAVRDLASPGAAFLEKRAKDQRYRQKKHAAKA